MASYTHGHHESVLRSHLWRTVENSAAYLAPHLEPGMSLLDVGCGPGNLTVDLARRVAPGRVAGIDNVDSIVRRATSDAPQDIGNVEFTVGDVYNMDFTDDTFDVVHAHQVLQHVNDPVGALREMRRVSRSGGIVAARDADYAAMKWYPADPRLERWRDLYRTVARGNGGEPDAGRHLLQWAGEAGFVDVEPSASIWRFDSPADRAWWGSLWADRVRDSAFADQAIDRGLASRSDLDEIAAGWLEWTAHPDGWFTVSHNEIIASVP
ncbi:MAG: methyltransferase domain-containing protein [Actinomycetota bacterium]|nr:methyltransferase domain-containing protein [Actinomycetota bacterium]